MQKKTKQGKGKKREWITDKGLRPFTERPSQPEGKEVSELFSYFTANIIREEKELDWTFLSPALEMHPGTSGTRKGAYRTGLENPVFDENMRSVISVEDVGAAIADELENPQNIRKRFTVAY